MALYNKNTFRSLPSVLSFYNGGLYVGNFLPGPPVNNTGSDLFGNKQTGSAKNYKSEISDLGNKSNSWAIVLDVSDYIVSLNKSFRSPAETSSYIDTSSFDGLYNKETSNSAFYTRLKKQSYRGYSDWYVPSVDELAFIAKNLPIGFYVPRKFTAMSSEIYRSSTVSIRGNITSDINSRKTHSYYYGQSFDKTKYGEVSNITEYSTESPIRLIRRVNLISI